MLDVLVFAAHPDDAEIGMAGTIAKFTQSGLKVGIVDMTAGEMGTRGSKELRKKEAAEAADVLGLTLRENLNLPDGRLKLNEEFVKRIVEKIRQHKPKIIFATYFNDRHPDHVGAGEIVKEAMFYSGVQKYETELDGKAQEYYRPEKLFYYMMTYEFTPSFIIDITETWEAKDKALKAFASQFYSERKNDEPETFISKPIFIKAIEARARVYGFKIRKEYGEPFFCEEDIELDLISMIKG